MRRNCIICHCISTKSGEEKTFLKIKQKKIKQRNLLKKKIRVFLWEVLYTNYYFSPNTEISTSFIRLLTSSLGGLKCRSNDQIFLTFFMTDLRMWYILIIFLSLISALRCCKIKKGKGVNKKVICLGRNYFSYL